MYGDAHLIGHAGMNSSFVVNKGLGLKTDVTPSNYHQKPEVRKVISHNKPSSFNFFLNNFWNRLVTKPEAFKQQINTSVYHLLEEERGLAASNLIQTVLAKHLNISTASGELNKATLKSNKIYHEDFPGDFILEYNGDRLGLFLLDICQDSKGNHTTNYQFKSHIKSFKGLY